MDRALLTAARALDRGDVLSALGIVSLRDDAPALALRGVAMAQLGELPRARDLLRRARRRAASTDAVLRARSLLAEMEVALALRDLSISARELSEAGAALEARGDRANATFARVLEAQRLVLVGQLPEAAAILSQVDSPLAPPAVVARLELLRFELAARRVDAKAARRALDRAWRAARLAAIPALDREVEGATRAFATPVARLIARGHSRPLLLPEVERLFSSPSLVVDALGRTVRHARDTAVLSRRPVLFVLARALGEAWPSDVSREQLIAHAFGASRPNDSHRARLRVQMARLRRALSPLAAIEATRRGFVLRPRRASEVAVVCPPVDGEHADVVALLSDGQAWSSSAVALALGRSQRTVQRVLVSLEAEGKVRSLGRARAQRWFAAPLSGFTPTLLLPGPVRLG